MPRNIFNILALGFMFSMHPLQAEQRLELESTEIIGIQELPRIVTILSWQRTTPLDLPIIESHLQAELLPLDREEFERAMRYRQVQRGRAGTVPP